MPDKSTILLILLAGNKTTAFQIDPLLAEVQAGLMAMPLNSNRPDVHCLYLRRSATGRQFTIGTNTASMRSDAVGGLTNFPPSGSTSLNGSVSSQVIRFLQHVRQNLTATGPVHVLIGAHGDPVRGFRLAF